jgi:type VI protein secretion system component VasK
MPPEARNQFIRDMVERLAMRLREDGSDVEGWLRPLRAYMVMGERDKKKTAATEAAEWVGSILSARANLQRLMSVRATRKPVSKLRPISGGRKWRRSERTS